MPSQHASDRSAGNAIQLRFSFEPAVASAPDTVGAPGPLFVRHRRARRYILRLTPDGRPRVTIPRGGSKREAAEFLARHAAWVDGQRLRQAQRHGRASRPWTTGDRVWCRGVLALVRVSTGEGRQVVTLGGDLVETSQDATPQVAIERQLRRIATAELPSRLRCLAAEHGVTVTRVTVRDQRTRWGSCSPSGAISLNWRLIQMPESVRDYVLVHELMHLCEANHSRRFWRLVAAACPWHVEARRWLRRHGQALHEPLAGRPANDAGA